MKASSSTPAKGLNMLMITVPTPKAGMVAEYFMTKGFSASPTLNCSGPKATGATARLRTT
jgi:hypothetical protein